jgi:hypothetical protein
MHKLLRGVSETLQYSVSTASRNQDRRHSATRTMLLLHEKFGRRYQQRNTIRRRRLGANLCDSQLQQHTSASRHPALLVEERAKDATRQDAQHRSQHRQDPEFREVGLFVCTVIELICTI